jgi:hypothetical protein
VTAAAPPAISEAALHRAVAEYLDWVLKPPVIWTSLDAGAGKMSIKTAQQRKLRGVKKGWPDILIIAPGPNVLGIELKIKGNYQSPEQRGVEEGFCALRIQYSVCRSVEEVGKALDFIKIPRAVA